MDLTCHTWILSCRRMFGPIVQSKRNPTAYKKIIYYYVRPTLWKQLGTGSPMCDGLVSTHFWLYNVHKNLAKSVINTIIVKKALYILLIHLLPHFPLLSYRFCISRFILSTTFFTYWEMPLLAMNNV